MSNDKVEKLKVGQTKSSAFYKTRSGLKARIYAVDGYVWFSTEDTDYKSDRMVRAPWLDEP